jgi:hypothetical protein
MHALDVLAKITQTAEVTVERSQRVMQIAQRSAKPVSIIEARLGHDVGGSLCEGHPQAVVVMWARCDQPARGNGQVKRREELKDRDLALEPP